MLLSLRKNGPTSLFREVRVFKVGGRGGCKPRWHCLCGFLPHVAGLHVMPHVLWRVPSPCCALQMAVKPKLAHYSTFSSLTISQGQILAVWILAAKLPNSDLNFWVIFILLLLSKEKGPKKSKKLSLQNSPGTLLGKIPLGFLQKPFLDN